jgi:hypothetical protein
MLERIVCAATTLPWLPMEMSYLVGYLLMLHDGVLGNSPSLWLDFLLLACM